MSPTKIELINARYDGDIRYTDQFIGDLKSELDRLDLTKKTLLVIFSDHGEDLGDRGPHIYHKHGHRLYDELVRVVLIFSLPGQISPAFIRDYQARLIDIAPTILDILRIPFRTVDPLGKDSPTGPDNAKPILQGRSLTPVMKNPRIETDSWALSEAMEFDQEMKSIRYMSSSHAKLKLIYHAFKPATFQFFDLKADPLEKTDLGTVTSGPYIEMKKRMETYLEEIPGDEELKGAETKPDPELSEKLRSLGY